jgi:hypothetical protein
MGKRDTRGLLILFESQLTLSCLSTWWSEIETICVLGRRYGGVPLNNLIDFDWLVSKDGGVLGIDFEPPADVAEGELAKLHATLRSLGYVDVAPGMNVVWFSDQRWDDEDPQQAIRQDFAAAVYRADAETHAWGLAVNIDWLPEAQRERLRETKACWIDAECERVEFGTGKSLCREVSASNLYALRGWFGSLEGH